jgi:pimeloyl-ACP methyl ester carboxylesterase
VRNHQRHAFRHRLCLARTAPFPLRSEITELVDVSQTPLILFSGIAADESLTMPQKLTFPNLVVPAWPQPMERESVSGYCQRLADDLRPFGAIAVGGISFGGIIGLEVARFLKPECVILIGSLRGADELPWRIRALRPFLPLLPWIPISWMQWLAAAVPLWSAPLASIVKQFRHADPLTLRWSIRQILKWKVGPKLECPIYQIHGDRDFVFPISLTHPTETIRGGGHLISLTRSKQVNEFVRKCLEKHT